MRSEKDRTFFYFRRLFGLSQSFGIASICRMNAAKLHEHFRRINRIIEADQRSTADSLLPVHVDVLEYLSICDRNNNTPAAVSDYLGVTRGTVSQSILVLEDRGFVKKTPDANDGRVVHLQLTASGKKALKRAVPSAALKSACRKLGAAKQKRLASDLEKLLEGLLSSRG